MRSVRRSIAVFIAACLFATAGADDDQISLVVENGLGEALDLWWENPRGRNVRQGHIRKGKTIELGSYEGHVFYATIPGSPIRLRKFTVSAEQPRVTITAESEVCEQPESYDSDDRPCKDKYKNKCRALAGANGVGCHNAPGWMIMFCPATCDEELDACRMREPYRRCNRTKLFNDNNVPLTPAFEPGSGQLDAFFEGLEEKYGADLGAKIVSREPWIATFDTFLTPEEAVALREAPEDGTFARSTDEGETDEFGLTGQRTSETRTSTNAWCTGSCEQNEVVKRVVKRISTLTNVSKTHFESFQMLHYTKGQYYRRHHDYSGTEGPLLDPAGPRVLTFFMYLSDVEEGGETEFPDLEPPIKVAPKVGKALLWPSVLDDMDSQQPGTFHQANDVIKGVKYAANAWIHLHNYEVPNFWGCTGSFTTSDDDA